MIPSMLSSRLSGRDGLLLCLWMAAAAACALALPAHAFPHPITQLKRLYRETPVVVKGRAEALILVPDTAAGRKAGQTVAKRVKAVSGVTVPVTTDATRAELRATNVIALGNLLDNGLIERLYWNRYSFADKLYPGPGKFTLRSVCNPYPWAVGKNAFVVEASDDAGMLAGAQALVERIGGGPEVVLPWTLAVSAPDAALAPRSPERRASARAAGTRRQTLKVEDGFYFANRAMQAYLKTADPVFLEQAKLDLDGMCAVYEKDPQHHLSWPDETNSEWIMPGWDAIEESDGLTDAERLRYTNLLLTELRAHPQHIYEYANLENATSITWNHITFPLMGLYFSSRYFRAYYPDVDREQMEVFRRKIEACFAGQAKCWKPREDSAGYTAITPRHLVTWELAENRRTYIAQGFPLDLARYLMATGDPMGYTAGHGDHPGAKAPSDELGALPLIFYLTRDGRLLWRLNQLSGGEWRNPYWRDVTPVPPTNMLGVSVIPMHAEYYRWSDNLSFYGTPAAPHNVPMAQSFDKLTLRSGLTPDSQYLLVDGFGRGFHLHYDTNMIIKYTNAGEVLLIDSDYLVRNTTEHNGLSVVRNGRAETLIPALASRDATADLPGCLMAQTSVFDYNGVDWHRTILMVKGGPVALFDEAVAKEPADYTLWCVWKTLDEGREDVIDAQSYHLLRPAGERTGPPDQHFYVTNTGGPALQVAPRVNANNEAVKRLRQIANVSLARGQSYTYQNVLASVFGAPAAPRVRRLSDRAFTARVGTEEFLFGVGDPDRPETVGRLTVAARGFVLGRGRLWLMEGRRVTLDGAAIFQSAAPVVKEIAWTGPAVDALVAASSVAVAKPRSPKEVADKGRVRQAWTFQPDVAVYREGPEFLQSGDVDGDGQPEILYGAGNTLFVLNPEGRLLWKYAAKDRVRSCVVADLGADGGRSVVVGSEDGFVTVLDAHGKARRSWHCDVTLISGQGHGRDPNVTALAAADINGDGKVEILAGTRNCWLIAYSADGTELWKDSGQFHGVRRIFVADVDGDGKPEILSANRYGGIRIFGGDGQQKPGTVSELGDVSMALGRCLPGLPTIVNGSSTGVLKARRFGPEASEFEFTNNGFGVNEVACADLNGDGRDEILVASETGYLYCLDGHGKEAWRVLLGAVVRSVAAADLDGDGRREVIATAEDGSVWVLSGAGAVLGRAGGDAPALLAAACAGPGGALGLAAERDGRLRALVLEGATPPAR